MQAPILPLFVGLYAVEQTADLWLLGLNLWHTRRSGGVPEGLEGLLDPAVAERSRAHALASGTVALWRTAAAAALSLGLLLSGAIPLADRWFDTLLGVDGSSHEFVLLLGGLAVLSALVDLPFAAWLELGVERRFGLSGATPGAFLAGRLKGWLVSAALATPLLYAADAVICAGGETWWLSLACLLAALQVGAAWLWPSVVAPLLSPQLPLPPGPLRERIEAMARAAGLDPAAIRLVASGGQSNAALGGVWRPRLLLDAGLLERLGAAQLEAVVAHELGHHRRGHLGARLLLGVASTFAVMGLVALSLHWPALYTAFGFAGATPHAALALASVGGGLLAFWLAPAQAWLSRRQELEADAEAVRLTGRPEALGAALLDLDEGRLANPFPHPWFVAWRLSHPPLLDRLLALAGEEA